MPSDARYADNESSLVRVGIRVVPRYIRPYVFVGTFFYVARISQKLLGVNEQIKGVHLKQTIRDLKRIALHIKEKENTNMNMDEIRVEYQAELASIEDAKQLAAFWTK